MAERTRLVFGGGEIIVELPLKEMFNLIDLALAEPVQLLTIRPPDGDEIVINPLQIKWMERVDG